MRYVEAQGLRASVIGLGAWQFGSPEWGWGDGFGPAEAQAIVDRARQLGVTLIDTAETYGKGESERVLGHILARPEVRDSIVLASKVAPIWPTRDRVKVAGQASLERLGTDRLDLYQVHWPNPLVPQSSTMAGMRALQAGGLVRHVGVSNYTLGLWRAAEAALGGPVVSNQVQYNLLRRRPERELLGFAAGAGRLIIAYSPLAQGVLSGRYSAGNPPGGDRARLGGAPSRRGGDPRGQERRPAGIQRGGRGDRARRRRVPAPEPGRRPVPPRHAGKRERAGDPPRPLAGPAVATRPRPARARPASLRAARQPAASGSGRRRRTLAPCPGAASMVSSPPAASRRSAIDRRPRCPVAMARSRAWTSSKPIPSSSTSTSSRPSRSRPCTRTLLAPACLAMLARASCTTRNTSTSRSGSRRWSTSQRNSVAQALRCPSLSSCWPSAGASPSRSSSGGRRSNRNVRAAARPWSRFSRTCLAVQRRSPSASTPSLSMAASSTDRCIRAALSAWMASSCRLPASRRCSLSWAVMSWCSRPRRSRSARSRSVMSSATLITPATSSPSPSTAGSGP